MDIITGKSLSRRTVLRGLGATVALPFLDAMAPALKALERTSAGVTRRFQAIYTVQPDHDARLLQSAGIRI